MHSVVNDPLYRNKGSQQHYTFCIAVHRECLVEATPSSTIIEPRVAASISTAYKLRRLARGNRASNRLPTIALLRQRQIRVRIVDISEFLKAEAGLTCLNINF
jgi:hypothetical protein